MKKMEVAKEKNRSPEKCNLPKDKNNINIYILGDSMVKDVEGWKLKKSIDNGHNVYVIQDYVKPCICENNLDYT